PGDRRAGTAPERVAHLFVPGVDYSVVGPIEAERTPVDAGVYMHLVGQHAELDARPHVARGPSKVEQREGRRREEEDASAGLEAGAAGGVDLERHGVEPAVD